MREKLAGKKEYNARLERLESRANLPKVGEYGIFERSVNPNPRASHFDFDPDELEMQRYGAL